MRRILPLVLLAFGLTLAIVIGQRMSTDAMSVVIGVAVGIAASVPTSLLLVALLRKERGAPMPQDPPPSWGPYPPQLPMQSPNVIVLDPSQFGKAQWQMPLPPPAAEAGMRRLQVIGDDNEWTGSNW